MKLSDVLTGPDKWCQNRFGEDSEGHVCEPESRDAVKWCLAGAAMKIQKRLGCGREDDHIRSACYKLFDSFNYIAWQDQPERTWDEVAALIREVERNIYMTDAEIRLALCLLERDCPAVHSTEGTCGEHLCKDTGKVPLLDPALVRKSCPMFCHNSPTHPCCSGFRWVPSDNEMDWVRALNKAGYDIAFIGEPTEGFGPVEIKLRDYRDRRFWHGETVIQTAAQALGLKEAA